MNETKKRKLTVLLRTKMQVKTASNRTDSTKVTPPIGLTGTQTTPPSLGLTGIEAILPLPGPEATPPLLLY